MKRILLSLACLLAPALSQAQNPAPVPATTATIKALTPEPRAEAGNKARHERFNEISRKGEAQLVFLGDSITQGWEGAGRDQWEKNWAPLKAANFGIGGDRTEHVLWRLDNGNYDGLKPKLTVLMIGTNNTGHRMDPAADTAAGVKAIVEKLRAKQPQMKILVLGVFPRGEKPDDKMRVRTTEINGLISKLADGKDVFYLDLASTFVPTDGILNREIMPDFLHLSPKGYELWAAAIEPKVKELMAK
ncbi:MAG: platelet-activating factor acetylhydrolase IB subunit [Verrucomicrobiota bacterium]